MPKLLSLLALVFLIRYYDSTTGEFLAATIAPSDDCQAVKVKIDKQPDPEGMKTVTECVDETLVHDLIVPGSRT